MGNYVVIWTRSSYTSSTWRYLDHEEDRINIGKYLKSLDDTH